MGRQRLIETDELITMIDRYLYEELNGSTRKLTAANISRYLKQQGYNVEPRIVSRNKEAMEHVQALKEADPLSVTSVRVIVYQPLDLDEFVHKHRTPASVKKALSQREQYYAEVSDAAASAINRSRYIESQKEELYNELVQANAENKKLRDELAKTKNDLKNLKTSNQAMQRSIKTYVKPAIATELLKQDGYFSDNTETIAVDDIKDKIITADSDLQDLSNDLTRNFKENNNEEKTDI